MRTLPSVRQLRAFVAVYHTGQVSAAAQQLALTQPAVTVLLRELEGKLGLKLFDRSTRSLRRTEAAAEAIGFAERALAELEALGASMAELAGARRGRVRIAATSTVAQTLLPPVMRRFLDTHPEVAVEIEDVAPTVRGGDRRAVRGGPDDLAGREVDQDRLGERGAEVDAEDLRARLSQVPAPGRPPGRRRSRSRR